MTYQITHSLQYDYEPAVELAPHDIRLQPRMDAYQVLEKFELDIIPKPLGTTLTLDSLGNLVTRCWWPRSPISRLSVTARSKVKTQCENPFNYLLEPWAMTLPMDYPRSQLSSLSPYLNDSNLGFSDSSTVADWAQTILADCDFNTSQFLSTLTQTIYEQWHYQIREEGNPLPPIVTWQTRQGSCRDFVVLFMAACTAVGLASRFVSGYEEGDPAHSQTLHAWVEVFLPGAGWRGYDPTMGLAVCDRHIALVAHRVPGLTTPITGGYRGQTQASMQSAVTLHKR